MGHVEPEDRVDDLVARAADACEALGDDARGGRSRRLRLFEPRGFSVVTVEEIAKEAQISVRTFYRYFPAKEDAFQVRIDRRSGGVRAALARRPPDEAPLQAVRLALAEVVATEDLDPVRRPQPTTPKSKRASRRER